LSVWCWDTQLTSSLSSCMSLQGWRACFYLCPSAGRKLEPQRQHGDTEIPQSSEITGKCKTLQTQQVASKKSGPQLSTHLSTCLYSHSKQNPAVWQEIVWPCIRCNRCPHSLSDRLQSFVLLFKWLQIINCVMINNEYTIISVVKVLILTLEILLFEKRRSCFVFI
jgi:hypothetical protein